MGAAMQCFSSETRQKAYIPVQARLAASLPPDGFSTKTFAWQHFVLQVKVVRQIRIAKMLPELPVVS